MFKCKICGKECKNVFSLSHHIRNHKISSKDYFIQYLNNGITPVCYCGNAVSFVGIEKGFRIYCSTKCSNKSEKVKQKKIQTNLKLFGEKSIFKTEEFKEKYKQISQEKFGTDNPFGNKEVQKKIKETNLKIRGVEFATQGEDVKLKRRETRLKRDTENAKNKFFEMGFEIVSEYKHKSFLTIFKCNKCRAFFKEKPFNLYVRKHKCPICTPFVRSIIEGEIAEEIQKYIFSKFNEQFYIERNDRNIIAPLEIDILIPELNLSIEVNGDYWHSLPDRQKTDKLKVELIKNKSFKHLVIKECDWYEDKQSVFQKLDQLIEMDFESYSTNIFYFTGFEIFDEKEYL